MYEVLSLQCTYEINLNEIVAAFIPAPPIILPGKKPGDVEGMGPARERTRSFNVVGPLYTLSQQLVALGPGFFLGMETFC